MLALTDAALARIVIGATAVPPAKRRVWLRHIANRSIHHRASPQA